MTSGVRLVRHLRVSAPDEAAVRALLPRLEDALRCASLPDGGARVLLVRRLALGRVASGISAGALAQRVEQRLAESDVSWIDGGTAMAERAEHVCFASALDARLQLAARLLRGQPCEAWYWRLAVPEWRRGEPLALQLRAITLTVAGWPEAAAALPAWAAGVVRMGGAAWLAQVFDPTQGEVLLRRVGIAARRTAAARPMSHRQPAWLDALLGVAGEPDQDGKLETSAGPPEQRVGHEIEPAGCDAGRVADTPPMGAESRPDEAASHPQPTTAPTGSRRPPASDTRQKWSPYPIGAAAAEPDRVGHDDVLSPGSEPGNVMPDTDATGAHRVSRRPTRGSTDQAPVGSAENHPLETLAPALSAFDARLPGSRCAGLLFVLPVLARLGIVERCANAGLDCATFTREILRSVLQRLHVPPDDSAWALTTNPPAGVPPALPPDAPHQARVWRRDVRRWLRHGGGIGLARLVLRPGRIALTATHVDVHFRLADADLRVRRLGLDIDPGWLPWFGRVVGFHYDLAGP